TLVYGDEYRTLLARARIGFNRSIQGECNQRALEAAAAGALLFQEAGNREVPAFFHDGKEYVAYDDVDLEQLLEYYLTHEEHRRRLAEAGRRRVVDYGYEALWAAALAHLEAEWPQLQDRARRRSRQAVTFSPATEPGKSYFISSDTETPVDNLLARTW